MGKKKLETEILETTLKQRAYDGKWERIGKIRDHENSYTYYTETNQKMTYTPTKWVTIGVYDYLMFIDER